jgi:ABC-type multidrug transport system ATPase subunit
MIELGGVTVCYPGRPPIVALDGVTLRLQPGITVVRGASGAGKTTLLRVLARLQPPDEGNLRHPWGAAASPPARGLLRPWGGLTSACSRTGYVPQENRLTQSLTCEDGLRYLAAVRGLAAGRQDVAPLLARWGLDPVRTRRLDRLSSGEARRWLLAQSQLPTPHLWLLDEPLHALDALARQTLRAELAQHVRTAPRYAVVVSHDGQLDDLATAVVRLERGRVVAA